MKQDPDDLERRCPRLGGPVTFKYCRFVGPGRTPCWKIADCWWERFDVMAYLKAALSEEELKRLLESRPKPKVASILELIEQARQHVKENE
jgi:hypothetical protein